MAAALKFGFINPDADADDDAVDEDASTTPPPPTKPTSTTPTTLRLKLKQVVIIHRHGQRTPCHKHDRLKAQLPAPWQQCSLRPFVRALHTVLDNDDQRPVLQQDQPTVPDLHPDNIPEIRIIQGDELDHGHSLYSDETWKAINPKRIGNDCEAGMLTDVGKIHMMEIGKKLRAHYIDRLKFLPQHLNADFNRNHLYVRSTAYLRTIESTQYLLSGLFPLAMREPGPGSDIHIHIRATENAYPDGARCARLKELIRDFQTAGIAATQPLRASLANRISPVLHIDSSIAREAGYHVEVDTHVGGPLGRDLLFEEAVVLADNIICSTAAGDDLPKGLDKHVEADLKRVFFNGFWRMMQDGSDELKRLAIGRFLGDLSKTLESGVAAATAATSSAARMTHEVDSKDTAWPMLAVFSGHDSTLAPLLGVLGAPIVQDVVDSDTDSDTSSTTKVIHKWPGFGAVVALELYEDTSTSSNWLRRHDHYVRVNYNGKPLALPACSNSNSVLNRGHYLGDPTMCKLSTFMSLLQKYTPKNFEAECRATKQIDTTEGRALER